MTFIRAVGPPFVRLSRRVRIAGAMLLVAGAQAAWSDDAPSVQLGGTVMHADATRSLALMAVGPAGWQLYRAGGALTTEWKIDAVHVDEVVLRAADGRLAVVAMSAAHEPTASPGIPASVPATMPRLPAAAVAPVLHAPGPPRAAAKPLPMSPERAAALRSRPSAASIQAAQQEFELPAND
ncbi:hypothetical protein [Pseudacidovorax intermedius]|uniref:hypothetical protein n=1 Tax=Pseudacidovorax intermedius TaxID=433924 RepID=UPI0005C28D13|nr:hypothetical protein [Pseudacidovorax intermedius]